MAIKTNKPITSFSKTVQDLIAVINDMSTEHRAWETFSDLVSACSYAYAGAYCPHKETKNALEIKYMEIVKKYPKKTWNENSAKFLGTLVIHADDNIHNFTDLFGELYQAANFNSKTAGQFFTPEHVSAMMSRMALTKEKVDAELSNTGYVTLVEPSCGAGVSILQAAKTVYDLGYEPQKILFTRATDLDRLCAHITYLQLCLYCLPGIVEHGDTLTGEVFEVLPTPVYWLDGWQFKRR